MRALPLLAVLPLLAACGAKTLALPEDPVDRAATCGVVAAASARTAIKDVRAPLPLEAQGRIVHYALLAASESGRFDPAVASRASRRMSELQEKVVEGKWKDLGPACDSAYPATRAAGTLPEARLDGQLACQGLADFLATALEAQETDYPKALGDYRRLRRELNDALGPGLRARAGADLDAQKTERAKSLAAAAKLGPPTAVMEQCGKRFD